MWVVLLILVVTLLYCIVQRKYNYWSRHGIPGPKPYPLVGNMWKNMIGKLSVGEIVTDIYRKYEGYPFVGIYKASVPCLIIRDPDFIKNITVKDFKSFEDNEVYVDKEVEPLFGRNPFLLKGEEWKKTRSQLTPSFTSGKMKGVFPMIDEIAKRMVRYVESKKVEATSTGIEAKNLCSKFSLDNVAACAFGTDAKCFEEGTSEFEDIVRKFLPPPSFKLFLLLLVPSLANLTSTKMVPKETEDKVIEMVTATIKYREENKIVRNDFLDYVSQLIKTIPNFTEIDATAHAANFLTDGFETVAHVMSFMVYELASNPEVQAKLREEINSYSTKNNSELSYETIHEMPYLDACFKESLRRNPPLFNLSKVCTQEYTYVSSNPYYKNLSVTIKPGTPIIVPVQGLHMDPKYYDSPEKYIPERFLKKDDLEKFTYLPFGEGPRSCLGKRFGIMQVKVGIVHLVKNFEMKLNSKTQLPLSYEPWHMVPSPKGGLWINLYKI